MTTFPAEENRSVTVATGSQALAIRAELRFKPGLDLRATASHAGGGGSFGHVSFYMSCFSPAALPDYKSDEAKRKASIL